MTKGNIDVVLDTKNVIESKLNQLGEKTIKTFTDRENFLNNEIEFLKSDNNFIEFKEFLYFSYKSGKTSSDLCQEANTLYEIYATYKYIYSNINTNVSIKYEKIGNQIDIFYGKEKLQQHKILNEGSNQSLHIADFVSNNLGLVFECKNYGGKGLGKEKNKNSLNSASKFLRDIYCYCKFCDKSNLNYNGVLLVRKLSQTLQNIKNEKIFDKNIIIQEIS